MPSVIFFPSAVSTQVLSVNCFPMAFLELQCQQMLRAAIESIFDDDSFKLPSPHAKAALETANQLVTWLKDDEHQQEFIKFSQELTSSLHTCFESQAASMKTRREKMWGTYHCLQTSANFKARWTTFLAKFSSTKPNPAFYQYVTDILFREIVKAKFPTNERQVSSGPKFQLTVEEANALHYAAGYVCHKLRKRLESSSNPQKEELVLLIMDLCGEDDTSDDSGEAENWTSMIDRGGLFHVSDSTYTLFHAMEEEVRNHLRKTPAHKITDGFKQKLLSSIASNEDVLFYWSMLSADADEEDAQTLLKMVIELWVTIRGFAFASSWIELYKQASKKTIQRSKALRRNVQDSSSTTD